MFQLSRLECETVVCALRTQLDSINSDLQSGKVTELGARSLYDTEQQVGALLDRFDRAGIRVVSYSDGEAYA